MHYASASLKQCSAIQGGLLVPTHPLESQCQPEPERFAAKLCLANTSSMLVQYCYSGVLKDLRRFPSSADTPQHLQLSHCLVTSCVASARVLGITIIVLKSASRHMSSVHDSFLLGDNYFSSLLITLKPCGIVGGPCG